MTHISITWQEAILLLITLTLVIHTYRSEQNDKARQRILSQNNTNTESTSSVEKSIEDMLSEEIKVGEVSHNVISFSQLKAHLKELIEYIAFKNSYKIETTIVLLNAKPSVAIVPYGEYERMKRLYEEIEMQEIQAIIEKRCGKGKKAKYIPLEELIEMHRKRQEGKSI